MAQVRTSSDYPAYDASADDMHGLGQFAPGDMPQQRCPDNILRFPASSPRESGTLAIDLIYQAADMFAGIEQRARDIEANARSMCQSAVDKLIDAERRVQVAERGRRDVIQDVDRRLQEVSRALADAHARVEAAEARAAAAEIRARSAEAETQNTRRILNHVERAIRDRLLGESPDGRFAFRGRMA